MAVQKIKITKLNQIIHLETVRRPMVKTAKIKATAFNYYIQN